MLIIFCCQKKTQALENARKEQQRQRQEAEKQRQMAQRRSGPGGPEMVMCGSRSRGGGFGGFGGGGGGAPKQRSMLSRENLVMRSEVCYSKSTSACAAPAMAKSAAPRARGSQQQQQQQAPSPASTQVTGGRFCQMCASFHREMQI